MEVGLAMALGALRAFSSVRCTGNGADCCVVVHSAVSLPTPEHALLQAPVELLQKQEWFNGS